MAPTAKRWVNGNVRVIVQNISAADLGAETTSLAC